MYTIVANTKPSRSTAIYTEKWKKLQVGYAAVLRSGCVCVFVCVCVLLEHPVCVYIATPVYNAWLIHFIKHEIKTSKWLVITFIYPFSSPPPLSSSSFLLPLLFLFPLPSPPPLSSLLSPLSSAVPELLLPNTRPALFCDGVCQRWRALLPLVS